MPLLILSGILYRLDGWGKGDNFLSFIKIKWGGINYTRYLIGPVVALYTGNWWFALTYGIAASIPYGEKHWWMNYGHFSWFLTGLIWGLASLNIAFAVWFAFLVTMSKALDIDHAAWETFVMGVAGVCIHIFKV
jgi:hypothetical protein